MIKYICHLFRILCKCASLKQVLLTESDFGVMQYCYKIRMYFTDAGFIVIE